MARAKTKDRPETKKKKKPRLPKPPACLSPEAQRAAREQFFAERGTKPPIDFDEFVAKAQKIWPKGEDVDEFVATLHALRAKGNGRQPLPKPPACDCGTGRR